MEQTGAERQTEQSLPDLQISQAQPESVLPVWMALEPMFRKAIAQGEGDSTTPERILSQLLAGNLSLWVVHRGPEIIAGLVVNVRQHPAKKAVVVEIAAGRDLDAWADGVEMLLREVRNKVGADTIEASCRPGLARRLAKRQWRRKAIIMQLN